MVSNALSIGEYIRIQSFKKKAAQLLPGLIFVILLTMYSCIYFPQSLQQARENVRPLERIKHLNFPD